MDQRLLSNAAMTVQRVFLVIFAIAPTAAFGGPLTDANVVEVKPLPGRVTIAPTSPDWCVKKSTGTPDLDEARSIDHIREAQLFTRTRLVDLAGVICATDV